MAEAMPVERLRDYLRELPPGAQTLLAAELERSLLRGQEAPGADLILEELRSAMRRGGSRPVRIGNPSRMFYRPVEPFLVDRHLPSGALPGRIARSCLTPIWQWICRDVVPGPAKAYSESVAPALLARDETAAADIARAFQRQVADAIGRLIAGAEGNDRIKRRLAAQIGTPHALDDVHNLFLILCNQEALARLASRLPRHIGNLAEEQLENVAALMLATARRQPDLLLFALLLVAHRLGAPWQLLRLAVKSADSDAASRVSQAPLALAVTLGLVDMRRALAELRLALTDGRIDDCLGLLKELHDAVRGMRTEMDLSGDTPWARELAAVRTDASNLLKTEIEAMPGRVRRLLRVRPASEIASGTELDPIEVAATGTRLALVMAGRIYAGELALNQSASSAYSEIHTQLETGASALLDALRVAGTSDRKYRQSQMDAAVHFSAKLLGAQYSAQLARAATAVAGDRKVMR